MQASQMKPSQAPQHSGHAGPSTQPLLNIARNGPNIWFWGPSSTISWYCRTWSLDLLADCSKEPNVAHTKPKDNPKMAKYVLIMQNGIL